MEETELGSDAVLMQSGELVLMEGSASRTTLAIGEQPVVVGRFPTCDSVVSSDRWVSGLHFEVIATRDAVQIRDRSTNGTRVSGVRVRDADLKDNDTIECGKRTVFRFRAREPHPVSTRSQDHFGGLAGRSAIMRDVFARCDEIAATDLSVLLCGETGVGKEVFARALHDVSRRGKYVVVDCSRIPPSLFESELFGHVKGAFTDAKTERKSPFVEADGGTVFIDEIGEIPYPLQMRLLRALAERRVMPIGGNREIPINVRVIAASRRDLVDAANAGLFRDDLYFRLAQVKITIPPLRQRLEDIPAIIERILADRGRAPGSYAFPEGALDRLQSYDWPGNVRQLRNVVEVAHSLAGNRFMIDIVKGLTEGGTVPGDVPQRPASASFAETMTTLAGPYKQVFGTFFRAYWEKQWKEAAGNVSTVARASKTDRKQVKAFLRKLGLLEGALRGGRPKKK